MEVPPCFAMAFRWLSRSQASHPSAPPAVLPAAGTRPGAAAFRPWRSHTARPVK